MCLNKSLKNKNRLSLGSRLTSSWDRVMMLKFCLILTAGIASLAPSYCGHLSVNCCSFFFFFLLPTWEKKNTRALSASVYNSLVTLFQVKLDAALIVFLCLSLMAGVKACLRAGKWLPEAEYEAGEGPQRSRINKCSLVS